MTAMLAALGLLPMALSHDIGSETMPRQIAVFLARSVEQLACDSQFIPELIQDGP